ncbi:MAG: tRNA (guanosine(46)-N7)-methyltransferase TrmB [Candidatus Bipolaricaulaceae bacterium]
MGLAVDRYFIRPETWTRLPGPWGAVFGRRAPLAVEIGFGNGEFLVRTAQQRPDWDFVGLELALTCLVKAGAKLAEAGVANVRLAKVDGRFALRELFWPGQLVRVYANFPCPWPKARHSDRRLVDGELARTLAHVLAPGGVFELTTDVDWYADRAAAALRAGGWFELEGPAPAGEGSTGTRYERKWRGQGRPIFHLAAVRVAAAEVRCIAEGEMPHAYVHREVSGEDIEALAGIKESWPGAAFVIKEAYLAPGGQGGLLRAFAADQGLHQHYFLAVSRGRRGWIVKLDGAATPFRTPAVKRSVAAAAAALEREGQ